MNKVVIRYSVFVAVFIGATIIFSILFNQGSTDLTMEMPMASLPVASVLMDEYSVNEMHGYVKPMDVSTFRESITCIGEDRELKFKLDLCGQHISELAFEVRSVDGKRLIESTAVTDYEKRNDTIYATVHLKDLIDRNKEYSFTIIATLKDGKKVYYYSRVIQSDDILTNSKIDFVMNFHKKTLNKEQVKELSKFIEPSSEGDNSSFHQVNIHSSLDQISYGKMQPKEWNQPVITICEYGNQIGTIRLNFTLSSKIKEEEHIYFVEEYFRVRQGKERFYLLDYERKMEEIFKMERESFANNKIELGIQQDDIQMAESDGGNILAFTNAGRVFSYNVSEYKLANLFSFFDKENFDARTTYRKSEVELLNVEENGNVTFMVYGYMNRGTHQGEVGIEVCYYNSLLNTTEEEIFVSYYKSPDILIHDVKKLAYFNSKNDLFTIVDGEVYKIGIEDKTYEKVISSIQDENFKSSTNHKMIAWGKENDRENGKTICLMNLDTENVTEQKANASENLCLVGFMNEDLVYGVIEERDITKDVMGNTVLPMKKILIQHEFGEVLKKYEQEGIYILDGEIIGNQLTLKRAMGSRPEGDTESNLQLKPTQDDQITSNAEEIAGTNQLNKVVTEVYETVDQIELKKEINTKELKFLRPREVMYEGGRKITIESKEAVSRFLLYKKGRIEAVYSDAAEAVEDAYEVVGTVTDIQGNEIYRRAEISTRNQIMAIKEPGIDKERSSLAVCLDTLLAYEGISRNTMNMLSSGQSVEKIMRNNLKDCEILNLSGCTMDAMLYYVNKDIPVLAVLDNDEAVLLLGFNQQNVVLMNPENGKIYKKGINDSRELFHHSGNQFITYAPKEESNSIN